jgi:hypothetical protein
MQWICNTVPPAGRKKPLRVSVHQNTSVCHFLQWRMRERIPNSNCTYYVLEHVYLYYSRLGIDVASTVVSYVDTTVRRLRPRGRRASAVAPARPPRWPDPTAPCNLQHRPRPLTSTGRPPLSSSTQAQKVTGQSQRCYLACVGRQQVSVSMPFF